jgi:uncharacterized membrane protein
MTKSLILGSLLGGLVLFVWGAISWMALPWHLTTLNKFKDEAAVAQVLTANAARAGVYILPNVHKHEPGISEEQKKAAEAEGLKRMQEGPFLFAAVRLTGSTSMGPQMIIQLVTQIVSALFVSWLLLKTRGLSYLGRVGFVMMIALVVAVISHVPYWNWWGFSTGYTFVAITDLIIGWLLAGLVIAKVTPVHT